MLKVHHKSFTVVYWRAMPGILTDSSIRQAVEAGDIQISPWNPEQVNPASYDVTLGDEVAVYDEWVHCYEREKTTYEDGRNFCIREAAIDVKREPTVRKFKMVPNYGWLLKPGIGYLMATAERISTLSYVPVLDGKSSIGRLFLKIHETAGYGDPGFDGQYTLEVTVVHPLRIYPGMRIGQIRFHTLEGAVERPYVWTGHYQGEKAYGPVGSQAFKQFLK
jgi:dCTP deaminase